MGYQELYIYLWHVLDRLKFREDATVLDVGGDFTHWQYFFENHPVKRYDMVNPFTPQYVPAEPMRLISLDAHNLSSLQSESYDLALSLETLEHLYNPVRAVDEMTRVLKVNGTIFLSCMCSYGYHPYPRDYWHIYPDAVDYMLRCFDLTEMIGYGTSETDPMGVWAWGTKREAPRQLELEKPAYLLKPYCFLPNREVLSTFLAERGYIYHPNEERLWTREGKLVGENPMLRGK